jgi:hypothetical protein
MITSPPLSPSPFYGEGVGGEVVKGENRWQKKKEI